MYYFNYTYRDLYPQERHAWRSAAEIEMAALAHENRRNQLMAEDAGAGPRSMPGILKFIQSSLNLLAFLVG